MEYLESKQNSAWPEVGTKEMCVRRIDGWKSEWLGEKVDGRTLLPGMRGGDLFVNIMTFIVYLYFLLGMISVTGIHSVSSPSSNLKEGQEQVNFKTIPSFPFLFLSL